MKELIEKITSYHILNYLLPGFVFAVIAEKLTSYSLINEDIVITVFLCYFFGLVISRFGSVIIEPLLKKTSFLKFAPYSDFVKVAKTDPKLDVLSETNNMYRTFSSVFIVLVLLKFWENIESRWHFLKENHIIIFVFVLLFFFVISYRKQTNYITSRIELKLKGQK